VPTTSSTCIRDMAWPSGPLLFQFLLALRRQLRASAVFQASHILTYQLGGLDHLTDRVGQHGQLTVGFDGSRRVGILVVNQRANGIQGVLDAWRNLTQISQKRGSGADLRG